MTDLSITEAARLLSLTRGRVLQLIDSEQLPARRVGRFWVIARADLDAMERRPRGRPRKAPLPPR